jgi:hypothetical protein
MLYDSVGKPLPEANSPPDDRGARILVTGGSRAVLYQFYVFGRGGVFSAARDRTKMRTHNDPVRTYHEHTNLPPLTTIVQSHAPPLGTHSGAIFIIPYSIASYLCGRIQIITVGFEVRVSRHARRSACAVFVKRECDIRCDMLSCPFK